MIENIGIEQFLILSTLMFFIGVYGFLVRKNLITMLMSVELILNAVNINFVAFNKYYYPENLQGHFFAMFVIAIAATEVAVAIAIIISLYRKIRTIDVEQVDEMKY
ncbi:MAG: NADH-quinone oxidoreductase subunit NuoK [Ignavibacteria bacterium]|jgi:NADH:ubiquinone oxidoreductase subunit K|nr:NADH-quinone oxidoreductase subunit NuoK [Ignavibacteria bacterium]MBK6876218.1 NADH-quinone oxidoreductase subunit NuoK [Ignavibacteria bacterium]MBK9226794.1 NADH-quinone oxidoreductase subunit NuoK [Ignavibacteria bacterium]